MKFYVTASSTLLILLLLKGPALAASQGILESGAVFEQVNLDRGIVVYRVANTNTYNQQGKLIRSVAFYDFDADGKTDEVDTTTWTYSNEGRLLSTIQENDYGNDGTIDSARIWIAAALARLPLSATERG